MTSSDLDNHHTLGRAKSTNIVTRKQKMLTSIVMTHRAIQVEQLEDRIESFQQQSLGLVMCAIIGVDRFHKSELAEAYALKFSKMPNSFVWRLDPDPDTSNNIASQVSYQQAYSRLLSNFHIEYPKADGMETLKDIHVRLAPLLWKKITQYSHPIVIFEKTGSYADIQLYLPTDNDIRVTILITTQQSNFFKSLKDPHFCITQELNQYEYAYRKDPDISCHH